MSSNGPPGTENSPEQCPELNDDYFATIGDTFNVIDQWEDNSNGSTPDPDVETRESSNKESKRTRRDSDRNVGRKSIRDKENGKKSRSPERRPNRRPISSPPRRRRSRSPLRYPRSSNSGQRPSFFDEITTKIPELKNDLRRSRLEEEMKIQSQAMQMMGGMNPNNQHGMMVHPNYLQGQNYMNPQGFSQIPQQGYAMMNGFNPYPNTFVNPMAPAPPIIQNYSAPEPVPAPAPVQISDPGPGPATSALKNATPKRSISKELGIKEAKKKAFVNRDITLVDFLRQVSHQKTKDATMADIKTKRLKVKDRCKKASNLLAELKTNKILLPFRFCSSQRSLKEDDQVFKLKSPLVMSNNNAQFLLQAKEADCRKAFESNPLRNMSGELFQFARNLGTDLSAMSNQIQKHVQVESHKKRIQDEADISSTSVNPALKQIHQSMQTDTVLCVRCEKQDSRKFDSRATQVRMEGNEVGVQCEPERGSFVVNLSVDEIEDVTREQHQALIQFCRAFKINDNRFEAKLQPNLERFDDRRSESREHEHRRHCSREQEADHFESRDRSEGRWNRPTNLRYSSRDRETGHSHKREVDDRMTFANPENPNNNQFMTFSPLRESPMRSPARSPKRKRISDRLGLKVQSPLHGHYQGSDSYGPISQGYRIPSPSPPPLNINHRDIRYRNEMELFPHREYRVPSDSPPSSSRHRPRGISPSHRRGRY